MYWEYKKFKGQHMQIPLTKYDILQIKYDVPLSFNKMNSTGQHIISFKNLFLSQNNLLKDRIHP